MGTEKQSNILFTCLTHRAIHLELEVTLVLTVSSWLYRDLNPDVALPEIH